MLTKQILRRKEVNHSIFTMTTIRLQRHCLTLHNITPHLLKAWHCMMYDNVHLSEVDIVVPYMLPFKGFLMWKQAPTGHRSSSPSKWMTSEGLFSLVLNNNNNSVYFPKWWGHYKKYHYSLVTGISDLSFLTLTWLLHDSYLSLT